MYESVSKTKNLTILVSPGMQTLSHIFIGIPHTAFYKRYDDIYISKWAS